eukprot:1187696-Prorocentrum_minimum.AAC.2
MALLRGACRVSRYSVTAAATTASLTAPSRLKIRLSMRCTAGAAPSTVNWCANTSRSMAEVTSPCAHRP